MILLPDFNPIAFYLLGWPIRWYGLCYFFGILGGLFYCRSVLTFFPALSRKALDDLVAWIIMGVIVGGRLGYVFFYDPLKFWHHPLEIFYVWEGGMSFHGGLLGVGISFVIFCWKEGLPFRTVSDCVSCGAPLAFMTGRFGNFINQEVYGRPTDLSWGMIFPQVDAMPRHPSQLYEAALEGLLLFLLLRILLISFKAALRPGLLTGVLVFGYGVARIICEFFRTPDAVWLMGNLELSSGQLFSIPLLLIGPLFWLIPSKVSCHDTP
ncbi:MAG: prolipoprotein diacylglyceryl transferase [Holosporales bacterium]